MTDLYSFLRNIKEQAAGPFGTAVISKDQWQWLEQYLSDPGILLEFKAKKIGEKTDGEPIMAMDFAIAGEGVEIFCLLTEAMVQNGNFAALVLNAGNFFTDHVPTCPDCQAAIKAANPTITNWTFKPHNDLP